MPLSRAASSRECWSLTRVEDETADSGMSIRRHLYCLRSCPEGDVEVFSGHFDKPLVNASTG